MRNDNPGFTLGGPMRLPATTVATRPISSRTSITRGFAPATMAGFGNTTPTDAFKNGDFSATAHRPADRRRRAGAAALRRADLRSRDHAAGQRYLRPRSVPRQRHSGEPPAAEPGGVADHAADGAPGPCQATANNVAGEPRRATRRGSWMRGTSCSASITASRRTSAPATASTGTAVRRSATAARSRRVQLRRQS